MKKRITAIFLALIMVLTLTPALDTPVSAEENTHHIGQYVNGYIPFENTYTMNGVKMVKDFNSNKNNSSKAIRSSSDDTLPETYRSDKEPWALGIKIKDQGRSSLCWACSLTSAIEYSYAKEIYEQTKQVGVINELSPGHIGQFFYNRVNDPLGNTFGDYNACPGGEDWSLFGGNNFFTIQHLASWSGLAKESTYPISDVGKHIIADKNYRDVWDNTTNVYPAAGAYDDEVTVQESILLYHPIKEQMKEYIYKYGALSASMEFSYDKYMNLDEINEETGEKYWIGRSFYNYTKSFSPDHGLTIIGWDDNYDRNNFAHVIESEVKQAKEKSKTDAEADLRSKAKEEAKAAISYDQPNREQQIEDYVEKYLKDHEAEIEEAVNKAEEEAKEKTRKKTTPDKNGAWIIQNSWGEEVHENGILYVSYESYDFNCEMTELYAFDLQPANTYKYNFQYDGNAYSSDSSDRTEDGSHLDYYTKPGTRAANIFINTTGEAVNLEAVGYTTFTSGKCEMDVSIYTGLTDHTNPTSGKLQGKTRVTSETRGCKTARLDTPVYIAPGETYSIVFDFTDYTNFGFESEINGKYFIFKADIDPGQSFFSRSKTSKWVDMDKYNACFRIKGFANPTALRPTPSEDTQTPAEDTTQATDNTTKEKTTLPVPKITKITSNKQTMTVSWKKLSTKERKKISGIQIQYSTSKNFKKGSKIIKASKKAKSKKITGKKPKKKYYVRIRSYKKTNNKKQTSKWSKTKTTKTK